MIVFSKNFSIYKSAKKIFFYVLFLIDYFKFFSKNNERFTIKWRNHLAMIFDKTKNTSFDVHYVYHPAWAARIILKNKPETHIDISSTLNFCTLLSAAIPVKFYDYRPANIELSNLDCFNGDLLSLPFDNNSVNSLSCMHTIEHIGLGRYGDKIDPDGDIKAIKELKRVLAFDGTLLIVLPIGKPMIRFNAHRIYSYDMVISLFNDLKLKEFSLIKESGDGGIINNANREMSDKEEYACGCFWFTK